MSNVRIGSQVFIIIAIAFFLSACASTGTKIETSNLSNIQKGQTNKQQIKDMFGEPNSVSRNSNGQTMWYYQYAAVKGTGNVLVSMIPIPGTSFLAPDPERESQSLTITFNDNEIVKDYSYTESSSES